MGIFDFLKPKTPEEKRDALFNRLRQEHMVKEKTSQMQSMITSMPHNDSHNDEDPDGIGEFGLVKTNPVPVNGIDNVMAYIDKLRYEYTSQTGSIAYFPVNCIRTMDGDKSKIGSKKPESDLPVGATAASNIKGHIDVYNLYSQGDEKLAKIYINSYSLITSNKIIKGFVHRDSISPIKDAKLLTHAIKYMKP